MSTSYYAVGFKGFRVTPTEYETKRRGCSCDTDLTQRYCGKCGREIWKGTEVVYKQDELLDDDQIYKGYNVEKSTEDGVWFVGLNLGQIDIIHDTFVSLVDFEIDRSELEQQLLQDEFKIEEFGLFLVSNYS